MMLCSLDWNALPARVSTGWVFGSWMDENSTVATPTEHGQVSECVDHNTQTIAAGLSQCLIMDILNDVVQFGLECFASKGLHGLGFWILDG